MRRFIRNLLASNPSLFHFTKKLELSIYDLIRKPFEGDYNIILKYVGKNKYKVILDVGANIGQSINDLQLLFKPRKIISFEANPLLALYLDKFTRSRCCDIEILYCGLSDQNEIFKLYVPFIKKVPVLGEASLDKNFVLSAKTTGRVAYDRIETVDVKLKVGDSFGFEPDLIKIDVQNHEQEVLQGFSKTLLRCKPDIFFENNDNTEQIVNFLEGTCSYKCYSIIENELIPYEPSHLANNIFSTVDNLRL